MYSFFFKPHLQDHANGTLPPVARSNRDSPAFDLAELGVGHIDEQGQPWHPYAHLQLGTQETISEVEHHPVLSSRLFPIYIYIVTALRHLDKTQKKKERER